MKLYIHVTCFKWFMSSLESNWFRAASRIQAGEVGKTFRDRLMHCSFWSFQGICSQYFSQFGSLNVNPFCWSIPPVESVGYRRLWLVLVILHANQDNGDDLLTPKATKLKLYLPQSSACYLWFIFVYQTAALSSLLLMRYRSLGVQFVIHLSGLFCGPCTRNIGTKHRFVWW